MPSLLNMCSRLHNEFLGRSTCDMNDPFDCSEIHRVKRDEPDQEIGVKARTAAIAKCGARSIG